MLNVVFGFIGELLPINKKRSKWLMLIGTCSNLNIKTVLNLITLLRLTVFLVDVARGDGVVAIG